MDWRTAFTLTPWFFESFVRRSATALVTVNPSDKAKEIGGCFGGWGGRNTMKEKAKAKMKAKLRLTEWRLRKGDEGDWHYRKFCTS